MKVPIGAFLLIVALAGSAEATGDGVVENIATLQTTHAEGNDKAQCWRIKSLARGNGPREGFEWQVTSASFFLSADGSGTALSGTAFSSGDQKKSDAAGKDGAAANAFDGKDDTSWIAKRMDAGEYVGLKLQEAKEVRSVSVKQLDESHGVKAAVLEKSNDCVSFARVAEFPNFAKSYGKTKLFAFNGLGTVPPGVFQIRSRHNVNACLGIKVPQSEAEDVKTGVPQKSFDAGAAVEMQVCNIDATPQFFSFDEDKKIVSAKHPAFVLTLAAVKEGSGATMTECLNRCKGINSSFALDGNSGFLRHVTSPNFVLQPAGGKFTPGTSIVTSACGSSTTPAVLSNCKDKTFAQWDMVPLFMIEKGKKAINCAPYSHTLNNAPISSSSQRVAQVACAKDEKCKVYMYAGSSAENSADRHKAWLCQALDTVYSGYAGFELGFRAENDNEEFEYEWD